MIEKINQELLSAISRVIPIFWIAVFLHFCVAVYLIELPRDTGIGLFVSASFRPLKDYFSGQQNILNQFTALQFSLALLLTLATAYISTAIKRSVFVLLTKIGGMRIWFDSQIKRATVAAEDMQATDATKQFLGKRLDAATQKMDRTAFAINLLFVVGLTPLYFYLLSSDIEVLGGVIALAAAISLLVSLYFFYIEKVIPIRIWRHVLEIELADFME